MIISGNCWPVNGYRVVEEDDLTEEDEDYDYNLGLNGFTFRCSDTKERVKVTFYYDKIYDTSKWIYKRYDSVKEKYYDINVVFGESFLGDKPVTTVSYYLTDGGEEDLDKAVNGMIYDLSGPATETDKSKGGKASIGNTVWLDINGNGIQEENEPGLENIKIKAIWYGLNGRYDQGRKDDVVYKAKTNHNGHYRIKNLPKGKYKVIVRKKSIKGYIQTYDHSGRLNNATTIKLKHKQRFTKADFGYRLK